MSYIEVTGKTEEEAVRKALTQLGLERDDVSLEILEQCQERLSWASAVRPPVSV